MSTGDLIDDDPDVGAAVSKILARGASALGDEPREDKRESRDDREPHEMQEDGDMDTSPDPVETKGQADEGAEQAADTEEQFLEIPGESEDAEPVKIPLSEAAEAVKQLRQMNGDIATAVTKAETEAYEKQDRITSSMAGLFRQLETEAKAAAQLMHEFAPPMPDRSMMETDPQRYIAQKEFYEEYVARYNRIVATIGQAQTGQSSVMTEAEKIEAEREHARAARYIPEFAKPDTREAKKADIIKGLAKFGVTAADMEGVTSHKAWRMLDRLAQLEGQQTKAPEVRKAVQEKAVKLTNGKMPARERDTGRFVSSDRKQLRETGSVEAAARLFMRSGLTKGL